MPAPIPQEIKDKVKMLAVQIGIREAARQCEIPEGTVQYWSANEGWMTEVEQAKEIKSALINKKGLQPASTKSPAEVMLGYSGKSKLFQGKALYKTSKEFSKKTGEELVRQTQALKNTVEASSKLFGWDQSTVNHTLVQVNILDQGSYREVKPNSPVVEQ